MFQRHRLLAIAVATAASAAIGVSGLTAASASPAAGAAHPATRPAVSGTEHLQLMTTSATTSKIKIIIYGVVTAAGVDHEGKGSVDVVKFKGGSFKLRHSNGKGPQHFNPTTCLLTVSEHGIYKIYAGTGKFAGFSGHGKYKLSILAIGRRDSGGKCSQKGAPLAFQQLIQASGPAHL